MSTLIRPSRLTASSGIIGRTHRRWALSSGVILALALGLYVADSARADAPTGESWARLAFGLAGFAMLVFASLPALRTHVPARATWVRGHVWAGILSAAFILFHAGFTPGGTLTSLLIWLLAIVVASGLFGAWLRRRVPRRMLRDVPMETTFSQIERLRAQLLEEAEGVVAAACEPEDVVPAMLSGDDAPAVLPEDAGAPADAVPGVADASGPGSMAADRAHLRTFYLREMRPFLQQPRRTDELADPTRARLRLERLRAAVAAPLHVAIGTLDTICAEQRQLIALSRTHGLVHGWLLIHVPLSFALLALALVHIAVALKYVTWRL